MIKRISSLNHGVILSAAIAVIIPLMHIANLYSIFPDTAISLILFSANISGIVCAFLIIQSATKRYQRFNYFVYTSAFAIFPISTLFLLVLFGLTETFSFFLFNLALLSGALITCVTKFPEKYKTPKNYFVYGIIGILIIVGSILRLYNIEKLSLWTDEATSAIVVNEILKGHGAVLADGSYYERGVIYHHYVAATAKTLSDLNITSDLAISARVANIPLFIIAVIFIFLTSNMLAGPWAGIIAATIFTFGWFPISMAREIRFYEFFIAFFSILLYLMTSLFDTYLKEGLGNKSFWILFFLSGLTYIISSNGHSATVLIFYAIILFGIFLLFLRDYKNGILFFLSSFLVLLSGLLIFYKKDFSFSNFIFHKQEYWQTSIGLPDVFTTYKYFIEADFYFLGLTVFALAVIPIVHQRKIIAWIYACVFGLYTIVALQGYGTQAIRYIYLLVPPASIIFGIGLSSILFAYKKQNLVFRGLIILLVTFIISLNLVSGLNESRGINDLKSKNEIKNINYNAAFSFLSKNMVNDDILISDSATINSYYVYSGLSPNYALLGTQERHSFKNTIYPYTNTPMITEINEIIENNPDKNIYVTVRYPDSIDLQSMRTLQTKGVMIFHNGVRIFKIDKQNITGI